MEFGFQLRVCSISPQTLEGLSLLFDKILNSVRGCAKHIAQSCKLKAKVTVETLNFMLTLYLILVEYLSKLDDVRSV